jgi:GT2 family glycosyltransferase
MADDAPSAVVSPVYPEKAGDMSPQVHLQGLDSPARPLVCVIPSRTDAYLHACLNSLESSEPGSTRCVVVGDNGISAEMKARWPQVRFVPVPAPFVFAKAINRMVAAAPPTADILVLNDDTEMVTAKWLTTIRHVLTLPTHRPYGMLSLQIDGGVGNPEQKVRGLLPGDVTEIATPVMFVAVIVPRVVWDAVGELDERFVGYGFDDNDYTKRIHDADFKGGVCGAATVKHGRDGVPHSSSYIKYLGQAEWSRQYELNGRIFQSKHGLLQAVERLCLNLGCGDRPRKQEGPDHWLNLDVKPFDGVDVVRDIRRGLPFNDGVFDHILADNILEHFDPDDFVFVLNEIDRVLKVGGTVEIIVPHAFSQGAYQDPTHKMFIVPRSCFYWNQEMSKYGGRFVGITANLVPMKLDDDVQVYGNMETEAFIKFRLTKKAVA